MPILLRCLFAFFVVMYAISSVNEGKYRVFGASLTEAFGSQGQSKSENAVPLSENEILLKSLVERRNARLAEQLRKQQEAMQRIAKNLNQVMAPLVTQWPSQRFPDQPWGGAGNKCQCAFQSG